MTPDKLVTALEVIMESQLHLCKWGAVPCGYSTGRTAVMTTVSVVICMTSDLLQQRAAESRDVLAHLLKDFVSAQLRTHLLSALREVLCLPA